MNGIRNQIDTLWFMVLLNQFLSVCSFCGDASLLLSLVIARFDAGRQRWWQEGSRAVTAVKNRWHSSTVTCKCNPKFIPTRPPSEQKRVNKHWIESFKTPGMFNCNKKILHRYAGFFPLESVRSAKVWPGVPVCLMLFFFPNRQDDSDSSSDSDGDWESPFLGLGPRHRRSWSPISVKDDGGCHNKNLGSCKLT